MPLVEALEAEGLSIWWDAHIGGGTNWRRDIEEHLNAAKCVLVVWTRRSVGPAGEFVRDEAGQAKKMGTYLPVLFDAVELPLGFREVQAISLKGWHGDPRDKRFVALAEAIQDRISGKHESRHLAHIASPRVSRRTLVAGGIGIGAIGIAATGGWLFMKPGSADAKRIAVMPFANLSGDPNQAYFADGIAEELRSALTRAGMQVIGRTSSDGVKDLDTKAAAAKLGVANVLTGSVRRSPQTIRIDAQLVSGSDGVERWAQTYDRAPGDAIKIQTDIAESVASSLRLALGAGGKSALTLGGTADSAAQDLVLQSRNLLSRASGPPALLKCIAFADAAIARDPNYADAYIVRAFALYALAVNFTTDAAQAITQVDQAADSANRALAIAPKLGPAHGAFALVEASRLRFPEALQQTRQALALSPNDPTVLGFANLYLPYLGAANEALQNADRFIALDPLNPSAFRRKAEALLVLGQYPQSIAAARKSLQLAPTGYNSHIFIGQSLLLMGRARDALPEFEAMPADDPFRISGEALVQARTGNPSGADQKLEQLRRQAGTTASYQYAQILAQLGQKDQSFAELNNAVASKDAGLIYLKADRFLDPLRSDPRYAALIEKLRFP